MTVRRRRRRRGVWWLESMGLGRLFGRRRVHKYRGKWYSVAPGEAYRGRKR